jgi:hypothetical protein
MLPPAAICASSASQTCTPVEHLRRGDQQSAYASRQRRQTAACLVLVYNVALELVVPAAVQLLLLNGSPNVDVAKPCGLSTKAS